jgi:hypothetical protein
MCQLGFRVTTGFRPEENLRLADNWCDVSRDPIYLRVDRDCSPHQDQLLPSPSQEPPCRDYLSNGRAKRIPSDLIPGCFSHAAART